MLLDAGIADDEMTAVLQRRRVAADLPRISIKAHTKMAEIYEEKIDQEVRGAY